MSLQGHKIYSLAFIAEHEYYNSNEIPERTEVIWDRDMGSLGESKRSFLGVRKFGIPVRGSLRSFHSEYTPLPLSDGKEHTLTLFCDVSGISYVQVDADRQARLGEPARRSVPITFYLRPNEVIDSLAVVTRGDDDGWQDQGPFLLVSFSCIVYSHFVASPSAHAPLISLQARTSLSRLLYCGHYIYPGLKMTDGALSTFGHEATHRPAGIFLNPLNRGLRHQASIGVVHEPRQRPQPRADPMSVPTPNQVEDATFLSDYWKRIFLSKGAFQDAQELRVQRNDRGCAGLLAEFHDGTKQILGRWDPANVETIDTLWRAEDGHAPLQSITFEFSNGDWIKERYIRNITANDKNETTDRHFKWDRLDEVRALIRLDDPTLKGSIHRDSDISLHKGNRVVVHTSIRLYGILGRKGHDPPEEQVFCVYRGRVEASESKLRALSTPLHRTGASYTFMAVGLCMSSPSSQLACVGPSAENDPGENVATPQTALNHMTSRYTAQ